MNSDYEFIVATPAIFFCRGEHEKVIGHLQKENRSSTALHPGTRLYSFLEKDEHENKVMGIG
ncbi:MAG TPA: hypothetical protein VMW38_00375 [Terriglobia bacterium]|nr:hypothetical protein [Terriglobia bacterium]